MAKGNLTMSALRKQITPAEPKADALADCLSFVIGQWRARLQAEEPARPDRTALATSTPPTIELEHAETAQA